MGELINRWIFRSINNIIKSLNMLSVFDDKGTESPYGKKKISKTTGENRARPQKNSILPPPHQTFGGEAITSRYASYASPIRLSHRLLPRSSAIGILFKDGSERHPSGQRGVRICSQPSGLEKRFKAHLICISPQRYER